MAMKQLNATEDDPSITISFFCPSGAYLFRVAAINNYGVTGELDEGVYAVIMEDDCPASREWPVWSTCIRTILTAKNVHKL